METKKQCSTCAFYNEDGPVSSCRVNAPSTARGSYQGFWPWVSGTDWCGKHKPKEGSRPKAGRPVVYTDDVILGMIKPLLVTRPMFIAELYRRVSAINPVNYVTFRNAIYSLMISKKLEQQDDGYVLPSSEIQSD